MADGIGKRFGDMVVLKSGGFQVHAGEISALLGRNGCGKTTLLKAAIGEIRMDHGVVRFRGEFMEHPRLWRMARGGLRYLPQEPVFPWSKTVLNLLQISARTKPGRSDREGVEDFEAVVDTLRLADLLDHRSRELSRGESRRVSLAMALVSNPSCLLLDEPFQALAPLDVDIVHDALIAAAKSGIGILITGHDVGVILRCAHRVIWSVAGTTHDLGTPDQARAHFQFKREYLGFRT